MAEEKLAAMHEAAVAATTTMVQLGVSIDIGPKSSELTCMVCFEYIQTADDHNQCVGCKKCICDGCVGRLVDDRKCEKCPARPACPACRSTAGWMRDGPIPRLIYPLVTKRCPHDGCGAKVIDVAGHLDVCRFRAVACGLCGANVSASGMHAHMMACFQWAKFESAQFGEAMRMLIDGKGCVAIDVGPKRGKTAEAKKAKASENNRMLHMWRVGEMVRMACVQMSCGAGEEKVVCVMKSSADEDVCRRMVVRVVGADMMRPAEVAVSELGAYNVFELGPGLHEYTIGDVYVIDVDGHGDWSPATLIDVMFGPSRGVFVTEDDRRKTVTVALVGDISKAIRPYTEDDMVRRQATIAFAELLAMRAVMGHDSGLSGIIGLGGLGGSGGRG